MSADLSPRVARAETCQRCKGTGVIVECYCDRQECPAGCSEPRRCYRTLHKGCDGTGTRWEVTDERAYTRADMEAALDHAGAVDDLRAALRALGGGAMTHDPIIWVPARSIVRPGEWLLDNVGPGGGGRPLTNDRGQMVYFPTRPDAEDYAAELEGRPLVVRSVAPIKKIVKKPAKPAPEGASRVKKIKAPTNPGTTRPGEPDRPIVRKKLIRR